MQAKGQSCYKQYTGIALSGNWLPKTRWTGQWVGQSGSNEADRTKQVKQSTIMIIYYENKNSQANARVLRYNTSLRPQRSHI